MHTLCGPIAGHTIWCHASQLWDRNLFQKGYFYQHLFLGWYEIQKFLKELLCWLEGKFNSFIQDYRMKIWQQKTEVVFLLSTTHQTWAELYLHSISTKEVQWALKHPFSAKLSWYHHLIVFCYSHPTCLFTFHAICQMNSKYLEEGTGFFIMFLKSCSCTSVLSWHS